MTFFEDLTTYSYNSQNTPEPGVLNVGWLGEGHDFSADRVSDEFIAALKELCLRPILLHRGVHPCEFCTDSVTGNGQIRVLHSNGNWYSAPTLVHHYVVEHQYLPPQDFIDAVLNGIAVAIEPDRIKHWPR